MVVISIGAGLSNEHWRGRGCRSDCAGNGRSWRRRSRLSLVLSDLELDPNALRVLDFPVGAKTHHAFDGVSLVEQAMVNSGITLLKYWLEVGPEEQTKVSKTALPTAASSGTFRKWT